MQKCKAQTQNGGYTARWLGGKVAGWPGGRVAGWAARAPPPPPPDLIRGVAPFGCCSVTCRESLTAIGHSNNQLDFSTMMLGTLWG